MARLRLESVFSLRMVAGSLSAMLHAGVFLLVAFSGGRQDGLEDDDTPVARLVMLQSPRSDHRTGIQSALLERPPVPVTVRRQLTVQDVQSPSLPLPDLELDADPAIGQDDGVDEAEVSDADEAVDADASNEADEAAVSPLVEIVAPDDIVVGAVDPLSMLVMPQRKASSLMQRIEHLARKKLKDKQRATVTWKQHGRQYHAQFVVERDPSGVELDRVVAEVSAEDRGRQLQTRIKLKRASFSQFTQIIDAWDPMVQLHDDEVVGRMHINSRFNVLSDSQARPALLGKVSTAAGSVNMESVGQRKDSDVFLEGIQTGAERISLDQVDPLEYALRDANARRHEFATDARIRFLADGSYWWGGIRSDSLQYRSEPSDQPIYFIAGRGATLYVHGVVAGKVLVYSPHKVVIEGSLTYARDPRKDPHSGDYLGLVCNRDIEVASPRVTGPGDVDIHAALFAKRRFVVMEFEHTSPATLRIYGSLAAGTVTASEPRYAMRIEHDRRFEQLRPPGFPAMNRFAVEDWDRQWTEVPVRVSSDGF